MPTNPRSHAPFLALGLVERVTRGYSNKNSVEILSKEYFSVSRKFSDSVLVGFHGDVAIVAVGIIGIIIIS